MHCLSYDVSCEEFNYQEFAQEVFNHILSGTIFLLNGRALILLSQLMFVKFLNHLLTPESDGRDIRVDTEYGKQFWSFVAYTSCIKFLING